MHNYYSRWYITILREHLSLPRFVFVLPLFVLYLLFVAASMLLIIFFIVVALLVCLSAMCCAYGCL